ncbi:MAG: serine O-acetyltransferase EpsC [Verrucomicrobiota bacterium]
MAECEVPGIVDALMQSYHDVGGINHIDSSNLPSKTAVGAICEGLLRLAFPGFHDEGAIESDELKEVTVKRVNQILPSLQLAIARGLRYKDENRKEDYFPEAKEMLCTFLRELPEVRRLLRTDVEAAYEGDPAAKSFEEIIVAYPCLEAIAIQRMAHVLYREDLPLVPRMMTEWAHSRTGIDIHPGARIGSHFFIDHGTGVVIGETCEIGSHVKLYHGVTLGARSFPKDGDGHIVKGQKRHPDVEDNVTIYPGAKILGGETRIGARSTIGANAFLMMSVAPDTFVALDGVEHTVSNKVEHKKKTTS